MKRKNESGVVLIITLWVIVILATVSLSYVRQINLEAKMVGFQRDTMIVDSVAKAGLRQALVLLREDRIKDSAEDIQETATRFMEDDNYRYDGGSEAWADNPDLYVDVPFYEIGDKTAYYYVDVEDESAKFPINNEKTTLDMIARLLVLSGVNERDSEGLAAAIVDWRDQNDIPEEAGNAGMGGGGGEENEVYNQGARRGRGRGRNAREVPEIIMKNAPLDSIDELLLIPGLTPDIVNGTVDPDDRRGRGRASRRRLGKGEYLGLRNLVTVYSNRFNLNTVKPEVLEAILYPALGEEAEKLAENWAEYRDGRDGETYTEDDQVLKTLDNSDNDDIHWTEVDGFDPNVMKALEPFMQIHSDMFTISCLADYQGLRKGYRVVVERYFTSWEQLPVFGIDTQKLEDLEQVNLQVRLFEPLFDASDRIDDMG